MRLLAVGVNHQSAPVSLRERLASADEALATRLAQLGDEVEALEWVHLSTCNRYEVYLAAPGDEPEGSSLVDLLLEVLGSEDPGSDRHCFYLHEGLDAVRHLYRVTASLDSMVLGEDQIQAQVKQAYRVACDGDTTGPLLNHLFHQALRVGKRIRTETEISRSPVSIATAGISMARRVFGDLSDCRVLVLGVGEMARLSLTHLRDRGASEFVVANRTVSRAVALALEFGGRGVGLDEVPDLLDRIDLVVAATGAPEPVLTREQVEPSVEGRIEPLLLVDLGVPRNLDSGIHELRATYLYDIDDLEQVTGESREQRRMAAARGEELAAEATSEFRSWLSSRQVVPMIRELVERSRAIAQLELERALRKLPGLEPEVRGACERAVTAAVNKLLHQPLVSLRSLEGGRESERTLSVVQDLFHLDTGPQETGLDESEERPAELQEAHS